MQSDFAPNSEARIHWQSTLLLNYIFAAKGFYSVVWSGLCVAISPAGFAPKSQLGGVVLYSLPIVIGLLVFFEWA